MGGELEGKMALVTGGGTGIGTGCARALLEAGATVTIVGRRAEVLEAGGRTGEAHAAYAYSLDVIQARSSRRRTRRLAALEGRVRAGLARTDTDR